MLQPLCKKLTGGLGRESLTQANLSAVIQTLSSIGQLQPDIFAPHAPAFASFILHTLLPAGENSTLFGRADHVQPVNVNAWYCTSGPHTMHAACCMAAPEPAYCP